MAKRKRMITARSELKKGFSIPTKKRIRSALNKLSKRKLVDLVLYTFGILPKTAKIKVLMKIDNAPKKRSVKKRSKVKRRKATQKKATTRRKTTRKSKRRRTPAQIRATKKLVALNKRRRR
jgi:hypothetical protein